MRGARCVHLHHSRGCKRKRFVICWGSCWRRRSSKLLMKMATPRLALTSLFLGTYFPEFDNLASVPQMQYGFLPTGSRKWTRSSGRWRIPSCRLYSLTSSKYETNRINSKRVTFAGGAERKASCKVRRCSSICSSISACPNSGMQLKQAPMNHISSRFVLSQVLYSPAIHDVGIYLNTHLRVLCRPIRFVRHRPLLLNLFRFVITCSLACFWAWQRNIFQTFGTSDIDAPPAKADMEPIRARLEDLRSSIEVRMNFT